MTSCAQCREFVSEFRAIRWGAAALAPVPAAIASEPAVNPILDKVGAGRDWSKQQLYALAGRADPTPVAGVRGPGTAAALLGCAAISTAGGATYCVTQGVPSPFAT